MLHDHHDHLRDHHRHDYRDHHHHDRHLRVRHDHRVRLAVLCNYLRHLCSNSLMRKNYHYQSLT